jgi:long-chain acyl-CoA synthetase
MLSFVGAVPLVLAHRFDAGAMLDLLERRKATFTIAAITAYTGLMDSDRLVDTDLSRLRAVYTGGAPVPPATVDRWRALTGLYLHNAYGLSESAAPCVAVPLGAEAPVEPGSGALSIGRPLEGTTVKVVGEGDAPVAVGEVGELVVEGPGVVSGYWEKPEESAYALRGGSLHTGDVGFIDKRGWVYLVDRKKDLINASGYTVWPREVEDALHDHPAVCEAAVVGRPDRYRGETVVAFVSLHGGTRSSPMTSSISAVSASPPTSDPPRSRCSRSCRRPRVGRSCGGRCGTRRSGRTVSRSAVSDVGIRHRPPASCRRWTHVQP